MTPSTHKPHALATLVASVSVLVCCHSHTSTHPPATAGDPMFEVGQSWTYATRPGDENSRVVIGRVEAIEGHAVIHVQIGGLSLPSAYADGGVQSQISHVPMDREALVASVSTRVDDLPLDRVAFEEGYSTWQTARDGEGAGWFTIPVAEVVGLIADATAGPPP